jgi:REP element-mobilizing transposase RayT
MKIHRDSQKRIYQPGAAYYVVGKTQDNFPYFKETIFCEVFLENLKISKKLKDFKLYGFSLIYDHFNLLIKPGDKFNYSKILQALKKNVSQDINKILGMYPEGANSNSRLRGVDITIYKQNFIAKYGDNKNIFPQFKWQKSFHDHIIRFHYNHLKKQKDWDNHYDYTVYNHLKHGLPENWQYTSLSYPELIDYLEI